MRTAVNPTACRSGSEHTPPERAGGTGAARLGFRCQAWAQGATMSSSYRARRRDVAIRLC
jgi:hypothetical protein